MVRFATVGESRAIDHLTQEQMGISSEELMERAGSDIAHSILLQYKKFLDRGVVVLCGPGNNGGDGLVIARLVKELKYQTTVIQTENHWSDSKDELSRCGVVVDALFGIGLSRAMSGWHGEAAALLSQRTHLQKVVSVDVPSGLNSDTGHALGAAIASDHTYTIGCLKPGFFLRDGPAHTGKITVLPIQFPPKLISKVAVSTFLFTRRNFQKALPERVASSNKSHFGKAVIVAGSNGKWGASLLSCRAAFRIGAGYVIASSFDSPVEVLGSSPEVMTMDPGDLIKFLQANSVKVALAVGPGLGFDSMRAQWLKKLVELAPKRVVLDADALTMLAEHSFGPLPSTWVLTPHSGELSRLLGIDSKQVDLDPLAATEEAVKRFGCHVLLKGYHSILGVKTRAGCKRIIIPTGNAALAKAGSGDVLTGMIAGLMSQGLSTKKATVMAAYLHGAIADKWTSDKKDISSLMASDIILNMPEVLGILRR